MHRPAPRPAGGAATDRRERRGSRADSRFAPRAVRQHASPAAGDPATSVATVVPRRDGVVLRVLRLPGVREPEVAKRCQGLAYVVVRVPPIMQWTMLASPNNEGSREILMMKLFRAAPLAVAAILIAAPVLAQDKSAGSKPADNMQIEMEQVKADKKVLVAGNMDLTEDEAKGFWPVYESYQKDLQGINSRLKKTIGAYAEAYNKGPIPDDTAKKLLNDALAVQESEVQLQRSYVPKLEKVLPPAKVARYRQIENKICAAAKYELADAIPLVK